jgi:hypothetical protein
MFDRHTHILGPRSVDVTARVIEQRAPTDESVRLLKEMEAAAREKVLSAVRLTGNDGFSAVVHKHEDMLTGDRIFRVMFEWQGDRVVTEYRAQDGEPREKTIHELIAAVSKKIAVKVLGDAFRGIRL